jgi:hypothetical protein
MAHAIEWTDERIKLVGGLILAGMAVLGIILLAAFGIGAGVIGAVATGLTGIVLGI